ncbi:MAG TPA: hypothetical protein VGL72_32080 [Bryobacteraceae bacterium]|jgi:hypothetical protein
MATLKQIAANRANAKKSTGPCTPQGKAKASLNAISHGFAGGVHFLRDEDPNEFYALQDDLVREYQPATHTEQILIEKMVLNQWLSLRATRLQGITLSSREPWNPIPNELGLLIRYQTAADRAFHKAHAELLKIQKERKNLEIGFVSENPEEAPADLPVSPEPASMQAAETLATLAREQEIAPPDEKLPQAA